MLASTRAEMVWPLRLAYWAVLIGLSIPVHAAIRLLIDRRLAGSSFWADSQALPRFKA